MAKGANQKLKMLYLAKIFLEETDEECPLTLKEITERLHQYDVNADRKTLYQDFEELRRFGLDIISVNEGKHYGYYLGSRTFELPELKLLVDSVQSARFISGRKSAELIEKIGKLAGPHEAKHLKRQVFLNGRIKSMNESIYYTVDRIHAAIEEDRQVKFQYYRWNVKKEAQLRREGAWYEVSPWALVQEDENYYLIAYDADADQIKHYRADKILHLEALDVKRRGQEAFGAYDLPKYMNRLFSMFAGEEQRVMLEAENGMANILIDRFGKDIPIIEADPDHFRTYVDVEVSDQFLGWIIALGDGIRISGPPQVIDQMKRITKRLQEQYEDDQKS